VYAGREHDHGRILYPRRCGGPERGQQLHGIGLHRTDPVPARHLRERGEHSPPVGHHVGHPGRDAHVVLEHAEPPDLVADEVDARDVAADVVRRPDARHHPVVVRRGHDNPSRDHTVGERPALAVDVCEERFQGTDALGDAGLDLSPFVSEQDPRDDVERERPLLATDVERHALVDEARLEVVGARADLLGLELGELTEHRAVGDADAFGAHDLVESPGGAGIVAEQAHLGKARFAVFQTGVGPVTCCYRAPAAPRPRPRRQGLRHDAREPSR